MVSHKNAIGYILTPPRKLGVLDDPDVAESIAQQEFKIANYLEEQTELQLLTTFIEHGEKKRNRNEWPVLEQTLKQCKEKNALLIIAVLKNLTNNDVFTTLLLDSGVEFFCCDQPLVNANNLRVLVEYQRKLRSLHGDLIRQGLERTTAKSGNPNAREVIGKVNRPKVEKAVIFAMLLYPVIAQFREAGFSQRRMVKELNDMGFFAPEGGQWVLSQLQKVLDRIRLNELAITQQSLLAQLQSQDLTELQIAAELDKQNIPSIRKNNWDEKQVKKLIDRVREIQEILEFCEYTNEMTPILTKYMQDGRSETEIISKLVQEKIKIPQSVLSELHETAV